MFTRDSTSALRARALPPALAFVLGLGSLCACANEALRQSTTQVDEERYERQETRELVALVDDDLTQCPTAAFTVIQDAATR